MTDHQRSEPSPETTHSGVKSAQPTGPRRDRKLSYSHIGVHTDFSFKNDVGSVVGLDIGGTLTKLSLFEPDDAPPALHDALRYLKASTTYGTSGRRDVHLSFYSAKLKGRFHFVHFSTSQIYGAVKILKRFKGVQKLFVTGGGAFKNAQLFQKELEISFSKCDELESVVKGIVFVLLEDPSTEPFTYAPRDGQKWNYADERNREFVRVPCPIRMDSASFFPFLVVNIGSGVSIIRVDGPNSFVRVSGTALGGSTFFGLCKLLTRIETFDEAMDLAALGDPACVNLAVKDIFGGAGYVRVGLPGNATAAFFGKAAQDAGVSRPASSSSNIERVMESAERRLDYREERRASERVQSGRYREPFDLARWLIPFKRRRRMKAFVSYHLHLFVALAATVAYLTFRCVDFLRKAAAMVSDVVYARTVADASAREFHVMLGGGATGSDNEIYVVLVFLGSVLLMLRSSWTNFDMLASARRKNERERAEASGASERSEREAKRTSERVFLDEDIARALCVMISQNITQIAFLNATLHDTDRIIFSGSFLRHNDIALRILTFNLRIWSKGRIESVFLAHEGYHGAVGSFLSSLGLNAAGAADAEERGVEKEKKERTETAKTKSFERKRSVGPLRSPDFGAVDSEELGSFEEFMDLTLG